MLMPAISCSNLGWTTPDGQSVLSGLDLRFQSERTALVGRNGVGKDLVLSTLATLRDAGSPGCFVTVPAESADAWQFFERCGFRGLSNVGSDPRVLYMGCALRPGVDIGR